jgi:hypothetical protein
MGIVVVPHKSEIVFSDLNSYAGVMYGKMEAVAMEKYSGYQVHLLKKWSDAPLTKIDVPCYVGSFSISSPATKQRWLLEENAIPFAGTHVSPADLARMYIGVKYDGVKRRICTDQWKNFYETYRQMPLSAYPVYLDEAYYVDIRSAYWSILTAVGWNVQYTPGKVVSIKDPITCYDFPFAHIKMARNCLVSIGAEKSRMIKFWDGKGKLEYRRGGNNFINRMLWCLVSDVLNGIAHDALSAGAVYAYTDGFIVPSSRTHAVVESVEAWGLPVAIKASGPCDITGPGSYSFEGGLTTKKYKKQRQHELHKITPVHSDWLRTRVQWAAKLNRVGGVIDDAFLTERLVRRRGAK